MVREETQECSEPGQRSRALVGAGTGQEHGRRLIGGRPSADFLTQLIVGADPGLRPSRLTRTQEAATRYARAAAGRW